MKHHFLFMSFFLLPLSAVTTFLVLAKKEQGTSADVSVHKVNVGALLTP